MSLLNTKHADPLSAAVSVAENRADKAQMLRADGLNGIAESSARRLFEDVQSFVAFEYAQLAHGEQVPDHVCERLHAATARARGEA
jgi:hypothetical protein